MGFVGTLEDSADARGEFAGREQAVGFDHLALAMHPLGFDRVQPRALDGQGAGHDPHAAARLADLSTCRLWAPSQSRTSLLRCQEALSHTSNSAILPAAASFVQAQARKRVVSARWRSPGGRPRSAATPLRAAGRPDRRSTSGPAGRSRPTPWGRGRPSRPSVRPTATAGRLVGCGPRMEGRVSQPAPPHLVFEGQRPVRVGHGQTNQAGAGAFFRAYSGSGLVIQSLARCHWTPSRASVARMVSSLTRSAVSPCSKLTSAASSTVHRPPAGRFAKGARTVVQYVA